MPESVLANVVIEAGAYDQGRSLTQWELFLVVNGVKWRVADVYARDANDAAQEFAGLLAEAVTAVKSQRAAQQARAERAEPYNAGKVPGWPGGKK